MLQWISTASFDGGIQWPRRRGFRQRCGQRSIRTECAERGLLLGSDAQAAKGKLIEVGDPLSWWQAALSDFAATALPLRSEHVAEIWNLPAIHQDPFDRALIAQAIAEGLKLVTTDAVIGQYAGERLRVVR